MVSSDLIVASIPQVFEEDKYILIDHGEVVYQFYAPNAETALKLKEEFDREDWKCATHLYVKVRE